MGNPVAIELTMALGTITDVTDGLRGLVPLVATAAEQHDEKSANAVAEQSPAAARIFDERKKSLRDALDAAVDKMHARLETLPVDRDAVERVTSAKFLTDPVGTVEAIAPDAMGIIGDLMGEFSNLPLTSLDEADYLRAYATAPMRASRRSLLLRSLYLTGLGSIEPLLARMVRLLLVHAEGHRYPSLTAPGLEERVRELCYGPPSKWRTSLVSDLGVEQLAEHLPGVAEADTAPGVGQQRGAQPGPADGPDQVRHRRVQHGRREHPGQQPGRGDRLAVDADEAGR